MNRLLLFCLINFSITLLSAQTINSITAFQNASAGWAFFSQADDQGNIYSFAKWSDSIFIESNNHQFRQTTPSKNHLFISKQDKNGRVIWFKTIGNQYYPTPIGLKLDNTGNPILFGNFEGQLDFDPGVGVSNLFGFGTSVLFVLKLDTAGNFQWVEKLEGANLVDDNSISIGNNGDIFMASRPSGPVDFDPDSTFATNFSTDFGFVLFSWSKDGLFNWAKLFDSPISFARITSMDIDEGTQDLIIIGEFGGSFDFDPSPQTAIRTVSGILDYFILKMDQFGQFKWVEVLGPSNLGFPPNLYLKTLEVAPQGSVYITGTFKDNIDFDPGPLVNMVTSRPLVEEEFILKLDKSGVFRWVKVLNNIDQFVLNSASDNQGGVYFVGKFEGTIDLDPGVNSDLFTSNGINDGFIFRLDSSGNYSHGTTIGGSFTTDINAVNIDKNYNIHIIGLLRGVSDLDPTSTIQNFTSRYNLYTPFVVNYFECVELTERINPQTCDFYESPSKNHIWSTTGVYTDTLLSSIGCDSIITINLTVNSIDTTTTITNTTISSNDSNATYQWLDCGNNYAAILSAKNSSFTPSLSGSYAVEITKNNCVDTSMCHPIIVTSIESYNLSNEITIFPNPSMGLFNLQISAPYERLFITDLSGRIIYNQYSNSQNEFLIDLSQFENGMYFITVINNDERAVKKLIKQ